MKIDRATERYIEQQIDTYLSYKPFGNWANYTAIERRLKARYMNLLEEHARRVFDANGIMLPTSQAILKGEVLFMKRHGYAHVAVQHIDQRDRRKRIHIGLMSGMPHPYAFASQEAKATKREIDIDKVLGE